MLDFKSGEIPRLISQDWYFNFIGVLRYGIWQKTKHLFVANPLRSLFRPLLAIIFLNCSISNVLSSLSTSGFWDQNKCLKPSKTPPSDDLFSILVASLGLFVLLIITITLPLNLNLCSYIIL